MLAYFPSLSHSRLVLLSTMNPELFLSFMIAAVGLTFMPGPDNLFVLSESIFRGSRRGIYLSAGLASGVLVHTSLAASGLALLLETHPILFQLLMTAGAAYLLYLAYGAFGDKNPKIVIGDKLDSSGTPAFGPSFRKGFLMNVLNPKVTVFFLALLPQFVDGSARWRPFMQMLMMGLSFMIQAFLIFSTIALLAGRLARFLESPSFIRFSRWFQIVLLSLLALGLLWSAWLD